MLCAKIIIIIKFGHSFPLKVSKSREGGGGEGESEEREEGEGELPYHTVVIDCAPIDSMGITVLEQVKSYNVMVH